MDVGGGAVGGAAHQQHMTDCKDRKAKTERTDYSQETVEKVFSFIAYLVNLKLEKAKMQPLLVRIEFTRRPQCKKK